MNDSSAKDAAPPCDTTRPFTSPVPVEGIPDGSEGARLTPDERTIYFATSATNASASGSDDIVQLNRSNARLTWLKAVNSPVRDMYPWINSDETQLLFSSNRSSGGGWQIFEYRRSPGASDFGGGRPITEFRLDGNVGYPWIWNGKELWLVTDAVGAGDIYHSALVNGSFATATAESNLNSAAIESAPILSSDGLTIFFGSGRDGGFQKDDIWTATRPTVNDAFVSSSIRNVVELNQNSSGNERPSWISPDGCRIYFGSDRSGPWKIYVAERPR
ncbi:TolB family protein [Pendulispora albinea]|uniref:Uncharacterized protein n=1 Tax=Pendulispora albinea TaxID=2741071 RepID=A0ABZ2LXV2_9BACT